MKTKSKTALEVLFRSAVGQAALELTLLVSLMIAIIGSIVVATGYMLHIRWANYNGQRALVCLATGQALATCKGILERRLQLSPYSTRASLNAANGQGQVEVITWAFGAKPHQIRRELRWW